MDNQTTMTQVEHILAEQQDKCYQQSKIHLSSMELYIETAMLLTGKQQRAAIRNIVLSSFGSGWRAARIQGIRDRLTL